MLVDTRTHTCKNGPDSCALRSGYFICTVKLYIVDAQAVKQNSARIASKIVAPTKRAHASTRSSVATRKRSPNSPSSPPLLSLLPRGTTMEWLHADSIEEGEAFDTDTNDNYGHPDPLNATDSFRYLESLTCTRAFVGAECLPGDAFAEQGGPLTLPAQNRDAFPSGDPSGSPTWHATRSYLSNLGCAMWRRGEFRRCGRLTTAQSASALVAHMPHVRFWFPQLPPLPPSHPASGAGLPTCDSVQMATHQLNEGRVDPVTRLWTPNACRLPYRFPHAQLDRCLGGKRVLFLGDSLYDRWPIDSCVSSEASPYAWSMRRQR